VLRRRSARVDDAGRIDGAEVDERPQDVGAGDRLPPLGNEPVEVARVVEHDAIESGPASFTDDGDIHGFDLRARHSPEPGRGTV
jgi:hypothetical protein